MGMMFCMFHVLEGETTLCLKSFFHCDFVAGITVLWVTEENNFK